MRAGLLILLLLLASPAHAEQSACLTAAVSRYVRETERSLSRTFAVAAQCDVILGFDQADALFSVRVPPPLGGG